MLSEEEKKQLTTALGREPSDTEISIVSVLWSERRSYKSSKRWFNLFKTEGERVVIGLGEGAGLIDLGDDVLLGVAMESNNHPTKINPYVGAALGTAGVISDVIAHGCRPIGLLNSLRFGKPQEKAQKNALSEAVRGISDFAHGVGIPMLGGDLEFDDSFSDNCIFNIACIGITKSSKIVRSIANIPGHHLVIFGAKTENIRIMDDTTGASEDGKGTPGNPLAKRVVIETLEELLESNLLQGIEDLGGGGLAGAGAKLAAHGNTGARIELEKVPVTDEELDAIDILLSESQDRMLAVIAPDNLSQVLSILDASGTPHAVVGQVTDDGLYTVVHHGQETASLPVVLVTSGFPEPERVEEYLPERTASLVWVKEPENPAKTLLEILESINIASREWVYSQFDQHIQANTVMDIGDNAGVVELEDCRKVAFATSSNSFWCQLDPQTGTANSAALALRNLVSTGATPLFIADCLNVGNPERPESYAEFVEAAKGLGRFSHDFDIPVVTGNVSPYNERIVDGVSNRIKPTSQVLLGGVLPRDRPPIRRTLCTPWANIYLIGETYRELNGTEFQRYQLQESRGLPPEYQPQSEKRAMDAVLKTQKQGLVRSCNNVGRGGLSIALMKMVMKSEYGFTLDLRDIPGTAGSITEALYSESSARYLMEVTESNQEAFLRIVRESGAAATELGLTVNERIANFGEFSLSIEAARESFKRGLAQHL